MSSETLAPRWGWRWLLLGALALAACGGTQALPEEDVPAEVEGTVSAMHGRAREPGPVPTYSTPSFATGPVVATDGKLFLTVWHDGSRPGSIYAARVKDGRLLEPESLQLNPYPGMVGIPGVAFDGKQFLVVWAGETAVYLTRVQRDGTVLGPPMPIADAPGGPAGVPAIGCGWRKCLVAWPNFFDPQGVRGVIVETDDSGFGTREILIAPSIPVISSFGVSVAWGHDRFLVVWSDGRLGDPKIFASRVRCNGTVLDPSGFLLSDTPGVQTFMDVVTTKQGFLVAWSDSRRGTLDIFGTLVKSNGSVPDPDGFPISSGPEDDIIPSLAYDGQRVLATWTRLTAEPPERISIRGNFVKSDGSLVYPDSILLSGNEFVREGDQDVVYDDGKFFMVYGGAPTVDEPPFQVILGTRLKKDGTRVDDPAIRISHSPSVEGTAVLPVAR
jgi:hypothetical protein